MGKLPSVRDYFKEHIDPSVDLQKSPKLPCPFHHEVHGTSLSYKADTDTLTCFGKCHFYNADVIEVHRRFWHFTTREEAERSIRAMYNAPDNNINFMEKPEEPKSDESKVRYGIAYNNALRVATTIETWLELDYIMSQSPVDVKKLEMFYDMYK